MVTKLKAAVLGSGPAGLTAAIYLARGAAEPYVFAGSQPGGQLTTTTEVENWPGHSDGILGPNLMTEMTKQAERFGAKIIYETVNSVDFSKRPFILKSDSQEFSAECVIIATGATAKTLHLPKEKELMGRGLSTCATCDGFFYKNKTVAVVGGGDSAMEEANYLAKLASKVYILHRRSEFRASKIMLERAQKNPKIEFMLPYEVDSLVEQGNLGLVALKLKNIETNEIKELKVDGLFMAIGHTPNSQVVSKFIKTDSNGYILVKNNTETNIEGVFAAGDIADHTFRQAITAAGMGCQAGMQALRFLEEHT